MSVAEPRRIVLLRHAKADWPQVADHERPLAERGRKDAPVAGRRLADSGFDFDLALCSTSTRTRETWKLAVHELPHRPKTVYEERIYDASPGELVAVLNETPEDARTVVLIGHNPGVHGLAEVLTGRADAGARDRMTRRGFPTSAFAVLTFDGPWKTLEPGAASLDDYWAPSE
ncbi:MULTISPECIES: SixA phosphatase family protein [Streptomyces]|jgi:phosphohistidine phosphatase|uniref:Phosphohistidine phosphatase SixA n=2 Tax=Streptomyces griseoaurantiacus TaxID=68213 RepID=F3NQS0_9ACTN|nr:MULTISPECIES: histidine phosphatase family protein [Streptomyces]GHE51707.1 phosphohistidine phosphatase [Streptomyces griseoaurantiacus]EGG43904.1 Phosphohistidine phosphatase SixA [Streptomyces griseoaurantiacus M045]MCF0088337.1 2,3-bisphosphoglycerate-dependent phosphoglycerate mutase [Streptomyces sp. MH192]MCF0100587.1 2,3-bisphosphoglycerate-dependent phosphoglycerate mutase [Streptomyces sp. MH191]WTI26147.1 histidine phosphatase family protein [Streptomyces jietaisiensis]